MADFCGCKCRAFVRHPIFAVVMPLFFGNADWQISAILPVLKIGTRIFAPISPAFPVLFARFIAASHWRWLCQKWEWVSIMVTKPTGKPRGRPPSAFKAAVKKAVDVTAGQAALQAFVMAKHRDDVQPLDIILDVAKGALPSVITDRQLQAAIAAAPYCHARLNAVAVKDVTPQSGEAVKRQALRRQMLEALLGLARPEPMTALEIEQHRDVIDATAPIRPKGDAS